LKTSDNHHWKAILYALLGFAGWTGGDTFMKLAAELGVPKYEIMSVGGLSGMVTIFAITFARGDLAKLHPRNLRHLALLAFTFSLNYGLFLIGLSHLPLANFYMIIFMTPMVVALLAILFLHEPLTWKKGVGIMAGFLGVLVALNPSHFHFNSDQGIGYGAAFVGMLICSLQMMVLRFLGNKETRECTAFYPRIGAILSGVAAMLFLGFAPMSARAVFYSVMTGAVGGCGWLAMAHAYRLAHAATVAPFHYSQIITGTLIGFFIWHDVPTWNLAVGAAIVIASGLYIAAHIHKAEKLLEKQIL
jgi:S-adenosylmethionine uptake transporter